MYAYVLFCNILLTKQTTCTTSKRRYAGAKTNLVKAVYINNQECTTYMIVYKVRINLSVLTTQLCTLCVYVFTCIFTADL